MKLYNIYRLCKQNIDLISKLKVTQNTESNASGKSITIYKVSDWKNYEKMLYLLRKAPVLESYVDKCLEVFSEYSREKDSFITSHSTYGSFNENKSILIKKMTNIIELYESMNIENNGVGIDIKLPHCEDLAEYISYLKELNFIFTQCPFLQYNNETLKFGSVDVGSNWLKLTVATASTFFILTNTASLIDKALILRSHYITLQQQEELLKSQQLKNELSQENIDTFNSLRTTYMSIIIEQLEKESEISLDHEERDKTERSLEKLILLLDKGCEIYASLDAPEEVQTLFPEIQGSLELPDNIMKYLEEKSDLITE